MPLNCTYHNDCVDCPAIPAHAAVPAQIVVTDTAGWTAGADSNGVLSGDLHTVFQVIPPVLGVIVGLKPSRSFVTQPSLLTHAFYLTVVAGIPFFRVLEGGIPKTNNAMWVDESDSFEIQRVGGVVSYWLNGENVYTSDARSYGAVVVNTCLFGSGDNVQ